MAWMAALRTPLSLRRRGPAPKRTHPRTDGILRVSPPVARPHTSRREYGFQPHHGIRHPQSFGPHSVALPGMSSHHAILSRAALYIAIAALVVNMGAAGMAHERCRTREFRAAAEDAGARLAAKPPTDPSATLVFVGDIMLSREIGRIMTERNDWAYPFRAVGDTLARADLAIGNLEGPISNRGANQGSMYSFRANPRATAGLPEAGFDIMTVAN